MIRPCEQASERARSFTAHCRPLVVLVSDNGDEDICLLCPFPPSVETAEASSSKSGGGDGSGRKGYTQARTLEHVISAVPTFDQPTSRITIAVEMARKARKKQRERGRTEWNKIGRQSKN